MEELFGKSDISKRINADGENLINLRFTDDVALFNEKRKQMERHLNSPNSESWPRKTQGKENIQLTTQTVKIIY